MKELSLTFNVKYSIWDYFHAVNYKFSIAQKLLRSRNNRYDYFVFKLIKPFVVIYFVLKSKLTKLKPLYRFKLDKQFSRAVDDSPFKAVNWSIFESFTETKKAIFLNLNVEQGKDGQTFIPKRALSTEELDVLINILKFNQVHEGEIDLNVASVGH